MNAAADTPANRALEQGFQLGELSIDPLAGEVSGPGGREKLDPKVMNVLVLLAQHAGHVVLREDLLARLWPKAVVTDDVLSRCIYELRRQLSVAGGDEQYRALLETVPKRGYRLNGEITASKSQPGAGPRIRPNRFFLSLAIVVPAAILLWFAVSRQMTGSTPEAQPPSAGATANSIAVLPFLDLSAGQDQGYLSDGVSEEILNRLARSGKLRVISRTSSFTFRDKPVDVPEIAARLNVSHVLEGSVRRSGDRVRITAQLIAASDNSHVWSQSFDRKLGDLFAIQDEIATSVASALQVALAGGAPPGRTPVSVEAYERFLQGRFFYDRRAPGDMERSVKYYEEAVFIDPDYATAWAALAGAYSILAWNEGQPPDKALLGKQGEAARRAVELDPRLAVAHARLAQFYLKTSDDEKGDEHWRVAVALDPDDPLVLGFSCGAAILRGDLDEALALQRRAVARDPLAATGRANLAKLLLADGQLDEAMSEYRKVLEISPGAMISASGIADSPGTDAGSEVNLEIVRVLVLQRRYDEAQSAIAQLPDGKLRDHGLALLWDMPGRLPEANLALQRLATRPEDSMDSIRLAEVYAFRGMSPEAFASLQARMEALERDENGRVWIRRFRHELNVSPFLKPLHADTRWAVLMPKAD
jgi:TolB-like protein/DNA-binding winged helix-turn-helix (wHTH) protein/tetratricopeptide (TPR) repeat protein